MLLHTFTHLIRSMHQCSNQPLMPITWTQAIDSIKDQKYNLYRNNQSEYDEHMKKIRSQYRTLTDYILHRKYGLPTIMSNENLIVSTDRIIEAIPILRQEDTPTRKISPLLLPNDFPYYFEPTISHYVLWNLYPLSDEEIDIELKSRLPSIFDKSSPQYGKDYFYWTNPTHLKSIPEVWHAQVIFRK